MRKILCFTILVVLFMQAFAQSEESNQFHVKDILYEKIYLHTDRELFSPREDIWFRVYLLSGIDHKPIQGYKNIYIELVSNTGAILDHRLILAYNGAAFGDFHLPDNIAEGAYSIRAYTKYLENFGEASLFHKRIHIVALDPKVQDNNKHEPVIDIGFYPEGGDIICNTKNNIAFKAIDRKGRGVEVTGHVVDDVGDTITTFETKFMGMGSFLFMPETDRKYYAVIDDYPDFQYYFDKIKPEGIAIQIEQKSSHLCVNLHKPTGEFVCDSVLVTGTHKGLKLFNESFTTALFSNEIILPKSKFPLGISKLTFLNGKGTILAERIVFVDNGFKEYISISASAENLATREKVCIELEPELPVGDSIQSGLSLAVVHNDYLQHSGYSMNIRSYLLLDSELKGPVEASALYFNDDPIGHTEKLNLLMLVQGWRSYYWPDIISSGPQMDATWGDIGLSVSGWVKKLFGNEYVNSGQVVIGPFSRNLLMLDTITDASGHFRFERLYLRDSTSLMIQAYNKRGKPNTEILADPMYRPNRRVAIRELDQNIQDRLIPNTFFRASYQKLTNEINYAKQFNRPWVEDAEKKLDEYFAWATGTHWIEEVVIEEKYDFRFSDFFKSKLELTYGKPDTSIILRNVEGDYIDIFDFLKSNPVQDVQVNGKSIQIRENTTPLYMIDEVVFNKEQFAKHSFSELDELQIIKKGNTNASANGVIAIYTIKGMVESWEPEERYVKGRVVLKVDGFQVPRRFYSPKYPLEEEAEPRPDYRPTLYWNPYVSLENGKAEIDFFTSDFKSDYIIIVEGISKDGVICLGRKTISVE